MKNVNCQNENDSMAKHSLENPLMDLIYALEKTFFNVDSDFHLVYLRKRHFRFLLFYKF